MKIKSIILMNLLLVMISLLFSFACSEKKGQSGKVDNIEKELMKDEKEGGESEKEGKLASFIPQFSEEKISKLTIKKGDSPEIELLRADKIWKLVKPIQSSADQKTLEQMVKQIAKIAPGTLKQEKADDLSKYGLEGKTAIALVIFEDGKEVANFLIGKSAPKRETYVLKTGTKDVYTIKGRIGNIFNRDANALRDKTILKLDEKDILGGAILPKGDPAVKFTKKEKGFQITEPANIAEIDEMTLKRWVTFVSNLRTLNFEDKLKENETGLDDPHCKIELKLAQDKEITLLIGKESDKENRFLKVADRPQIYLVSKHQVMMLIKKPADFKDKTILKLKKDEITRLILTDKESEIILEKEDPKSKSPRWKMVKPTEKEATAFLLKESRLMKMKQEKKKKEGEIDKPEGKDKAKKEEFKLDNRVVQRMVWMIASLRAIEIPDTVEAETTGLSESKEGIRVVLADKSEYQITFGKKVDEKKFKRFVKKQKKGEKEARVFVIPEYIYRSLVKKVGDLSLTRSMHRKTKLMDRMKMRRQVRPRPMRRPNQPVE